MFFHQTSIVALLLAASAAATALPSVEGWEDQFAVLGKRDLCNVHAAKGCWGCQIGDSWCEVTSDECGPPLPPLNTDSWSDLDPAPQQDQVSQAVPETSISEGVGHLFRKRDLLDPCPSEYTGYCANCNGCRVAVKGCCKGIGPTYC